MITDDVVEIIARAHYQARSTEWDDTPWERLDCYPMSYDLEMKAARAVLQALEERGMVGPVCVDDAAPKTEG